MKIAIIGVTGLVGRTFLKILEERNFPVTELIPVASEKSVGKKILFGNKEYDIVPIGKALRLEFDIALWSAGASISKEWMLPFVNFGKAYHIDNSSAWRLHPEVPLIVPEVNIQTLSPEQKIIANPNCSTIQLVTALAPLHKRFGIRRILISTYQAVSGTGQAALRQLEEERERGSATAPVYPKPIDLNCIPHCDVFLENGYTKEEMKLVNETRKILDDNSLQISATAVRVPVLYGHSESINVEFKRSVSPQEIKNVLASSEGIILAEPYITPREIAGRDEVFVSRIRKDLSQPNTVNMWIVADNLRKGAATNAVQIAEYIRENFFSGN